MFIRFVRAKSMKTRLLLTLKAFAHLSPGFALKPWDKGYVCFVATLKELRQLCDKRGATQLFQSCVFKKLSRPRVAKAQPWAGIGERFQRYPGGFAADGETG